jgi:hypothetical protein
MATVDETTQKVQRILASEFSNVMLAGDGYAIERGSTRVSIVVRDFGKDPEGNPSAVVRVAAIVAREVPATPELFHWAAVDGSQYFFGSVTALESEDKQQCTILFDHTLLGDYLDPAELASAVALVAGTADQLDDVVHEKFGGKRYTDA